MKPPPSFRHLEFKPKTILNQEGKFDQCRKYIHKIIVFKCIFFILRIERFTEIEKSNRILMEKMSDIIRNRETFCKFYYYFFLFIYLFK